MSPPQRLILNEVAEQLFTEFESKVSRGERSERTLEIYRQRWDTHIRPTFGRRRIQAIGVGACLAVPGGAETQDEPASQGGSQPELLSNWTVRGVINVVNVVVEHARQAGVLASNPVRRLTARSPRQRTGRRPGSWRRTKSRC